MIELLKFITCGSVDDGKSTLIGRMLYDAKLLYTDQKRALELDSKVGSRDGKIDYSLLLDGLMAEREQGITIDVAYRYFTTDNRSFIVADTPGHEEYTRNMAVGASFAELAVILIDASKGVLIQTRRHARICSLMGIRHFVFAVNKMDLVEYDKKVYEDISVEVRRFMQEFPYDSLRLIPVSATEGDNVTIPSVHMPWYETGRAEGTLLSYLETVDVSGNEEERQFILPVQRVCRPNQAFRGFQGQVEAGDIGIGDAVTVLPGRESARVKSVLVSGKEAAKASEGQAVTVTLDREVDVSRGCVLTKDTQAEVSNLLRVELLWMDDKALVAGMNYFLKLGTKFVPATVISIKYKVDINTGARIFAERIRKNEIAVCEIDTVEKIVVTPFSHCKALGGFVLIDRITNATSACGVVRHTLRRANNLFWQDTEITRGIREKHMGQKAFTVWFTGLSGSGKSAIANAVEKRLYGLGKYTMLLDGDNVRMGLNGNLGFKEQDRIENIRRIAEVSKLMNDAGLIVLAAFISPYERDRNKVREIVGKENFFEVYVNTPLEECERRDVKGLYRKAQSGEIPNFTGISSPYEPPENPDFIIDTTGKDIDECAQEVIQAINIFLKAQ